MPTFPNIKPLQDGANKSTTTKVLVNDFGDGYAQRVVDGVNNVRPTYSLEWIVNTSDRNTIEDFLETRGGYESFQLPSSIYTPLGETSSSLWRCDNWTIDMRGYDGTTYYWTISVTFRKEFDLTS